MVVFGQTGCIGANWLYSVIVVVFRQSGCIRAKVIVIFQSGSIPAEWLYSGKSGCTRAKLL